MIIKIKKHVKAFVMVDKSVIEDNRLSLKARGLLTYLLSRPPDWTIVMRHLLNQFKEGRDSVQSGFAELKKYGYARLEAQKGTDGRISGSSWVIYEEPIEVSTDGRVSRLSVIPATGQSATNKKDSNNKEKTDRQALSVRPLDSIQSKDDNCHIAPKLDQSFSLNNNTVESKAPSTRPRATRIDDQVKAVLRCHPCKIRASEAIPAIEKAIRENGYEAVLAATKAYAQHVVNSGTKEPSWPKYWFEEEQYKLFLPEPEQVNPESGLQLDEPDMLAVSSVTLPELSDEEVAEQNKQLAQYEARRREAALN
jgi:hypothetical protein